MTRKQRSFLFILMVFLFVIVGPSIVLYSQGYRVDFQNKKIIQTGAFYFRITPRNAQIEIKSLDDKKIRSVSTGFLFGTAYIENLLPRKYKIEILKENYHNWEKNLEIKEKMATEIKNVTLIPKNPEFEILTKDVNDLFYFPEKNALIIEKQEEENWTLLKKDWQTREFSILFASSLKENLLKIKELKNSDKILIKTKKNELINYYVLNIENENDIIEINLPDKIKNISFHPEKEKTVIFLENNSIFSYNYETKTTSSFLENVVTYSFDFHNNFFWLSNEGFLIKGFKNPEKINRNPLEIKEKKEFNIIFPNFSEKIIKTNNYYYLFNRELSMFEQIFESEYKPVVSPDLGKLFFSNGYEIKIMFLREANDQPQRNRLDEVFLTRFSQKIKDVDWYTSHYLLFTISNEIKIIEIDNRDNVNIVNLAEFKNPKSHFNLNTKKLYVLSEGKLFISEKLIP